jgi:tetratricopeptide (TPR) repeat protein
MDRSAMTSRRLLWSSHLCSRGLFASAVIAAACGAAGAAGQEGGGAADALPIGQAAEQAAPPVIAPPARPLNPALAKASAEGLARVFAAFSRRNLRKDELVLADLELSLLLAEQATILNPDDVFAWRALLNSSMLSDGTDPAVAALRRQSMDRILALDPGDEVIRFRRIVDAIEEAPTAEERVARYEKALEPANRAAIGDTVASQLALKLALLLQRTGDVEGFERWLGEAVTLDPASPAATAMAAGYFRFAADESLDNAELLMTTMTANPLERTGLRSFASILFDRGAYRGATRFLAIAADAEFTEFPLIEYEALLSDLALATWAAGDAAAAEGIIARRQRQLNEYGRRLQMQADQSLLASPERLADFRFPMLAESSAVRAAVVRSMGDPERAKEAMAELHRSIENQILRIDGKLKSALEQEKRSATPQEELDTKGQKASLKLEAALLTYWIGEDAKRGDELVLEADALIPLSEAAKARYAAWSALRSETPASALPLFEAIAARGEGETPAAALGLALAQIASGDQRSGARGLLEIWRTSRSTMFGIDARDRLAKLLGTAVPDDEEIAGLEALAASVPSSFDRMLREGARPLVARIRWGSRPVTVLDPLPITLELTNTTQWPLAISDAGPINDIYIFQGSVQSVNSSEINFTGEMGSLARSFVIPPRGTLSVPVDLAYTDFGIAMLQFVQPGCSVSLRGMVNWRITQGGFRPGYFGDEATADLVRIEGIRLNDDGIDATIERARMAASRDDLIDLVAVAGAASDAHRRPQGYPEARKAALAKLWDALPEIWSGFDPVTQAWLLVVLPDEIPPLRPMLAVARQSNDPLVRLSFLVRRASVSTDPVIEEAIASGDERIARYGRIIKEMLLHDEEISRRDFNLGTSGLPGQDGEAAPAPQDGGQDGGQGGAGGTAPSGAGAPASDAPPRP